MEGRVRDRGDKEREKERRTNHFCLFIYRGFMGIHVTHFSWER